MNIKTEAKFNLEDAASEVYEKAESMYKGSEITTDILDTIIDKYFSKKYSPRQLQTIKDYFKEQEEIFYSMYNDGNEITENKKVTELNEEGNIDNLKTIQDIEEYINNIKDEHTKSILHSIVEDEKSKENPSIGYLTMAIRKVLDIEKERNKKIKTESSEEITIPGLTSYKNIADTFKNYKAFEANFEPLVIVKIDRQYYVYRTTAESSQDYIYQTDNEYNIDGWLYGAVQANNGIFKVKTESLEEDINKQRIPTSELPDFCYSYNETTGEIIVIKKGVEGYYPSNIRLDNTLSGDERKQQAEELIKEQNEILGVTDDQRLQMELNSMFGWDDTKIENKKLNESTQQFIIGLTNKTVKELAEDETYDSYVEDIKDSDNIYGIEVGLTDNKEEALRFDNKTDAEIAASEIEQIQDTFQTVIVIAL